jgi:amino acid adenylation domain-containing protein
VPNGSLCESTNTPQRLCLHDLLVEQAERTPDAPAILASGRAPLTYGRLWRHVDEVVQALRAMGISRQDRVALVLPNGAEMAVALLAVAAGATCAPLNPAYGADEWAVYLADLHATALLIQVGMESPARAVALAHGIAIIELSPRREAEAGLFTLTGEAQPCPAPHGFAQPDDVGLMLHTTGSTSHAKIVALTHSNLCVSASNIAAALELAASDRCLNVMPLFHAHGLKGMVLPSLLAGASVACTPRFTAPEFFAWMAEFHPTWYSAVPTIHQAILAGAAGHRESTAGCPLRFIRSTSAPLPQQVLEALERLFNVPVIESYGTTEASMVTCNPLPPRPRKAGSVGVAVGAEVAIMDEVGNLLQAGGTGEVVVRRAGMLQSDDKAAAAHQSAGTAGWFRTGDQGYLDTDGYLFITGRMKETINRGGEKIAPQAVDDVLMDHPAVAQAVTFAMPHARLGEAVAAAVVLHPHALATDSDIRQFAAARLAAFKVPQRVFIVDDLPKGPTGKLQRLGLAERLGLTTPAQVPLADTTPGTPLEEVLAGLWAEVLEVERVGLHDNFYHLGGDSILATQFMSRIREAIHVEVSFRSFFATPTVAGVARSIETASQAMLDAPIPPIQRLPRDTALPLSYAQQRLWLLAQLGLSRHASTLLEAVRLHGALQVAALEQSLQEIIRRHEVLRTTFAHVEGLPCQVIRPPRPLPLPVVELREGPEQEREAQLRAMARAEAQRPFDLAQGPLVCVTLVRLADEEHVLLLTMHHIVFDGWSHGVFWRELSVLYEACSTGKPAPLPALAIQYADFAYWQQQWFQGDRLATHLAYWQQQLADVSPLQLPTDRPRPAVQTFRGARHPLMFSVALLQALKALSQQYGATLFMTLLAAFQLLLHRYTGQDDIVVGSLIANRNRIETEGLIGFFVNALVLRTDLSGNPSFRVLLDRVREVALGAYSHQDLPFEKLLETLQPRRDLSRTPLFQVLFVLQNTPWQPPELAGLTVRSLEVDPETANFDVWLNLSETPEGLRGWFEYSTDLFDAATIARMGRHLQTLLEGIVAHPEAPLSSLPWLQPDEQHRLLMEWNASQGDYPHDQCLHQLFEAQVARTPDAIAVVYKDEHLTYRQLNCRANQVAHYLQTLGVGAEVLVGLYIERSLAMVVGLLGILKAGGAYVPLDPTYPSERLAFMLEDSQVPVLLTQAHLVAGLPAPQAKVVCLDTDWPAIARHNDQNAVSGVTADNTVHLLYTSGSTGRPKGALGLHRAAVNVLAWVWHTYPVSSAEVCCQKISMNFGDFVQELFEPLLRGVRTVLIPDGVLRDLPRFVQTLATHCVTRIILGPSLLRVLLEAYVDLQHRLPRLTLWIVGGETLPRELRQRFQELMPYSRLFNSYGTSEVAGNVTWYDTGLMMPQELSHVPIGRPIANTQIYLLDRSLQPVPVGVPGELHVGGAVLARGYRNRPELTATQFIPNSFSDEPGARLYRTGDLARYLPDGNLAFLGRGDHQVKVRGFRVEPEEIEAALEQHAAVRQAVVLSREDVPGETRLVAYCVAAPELTPTVSTLRSFLQAKLPDYMIPTTFVWLEAMPLTPSRKIDRRALPAPDQARPALAEAYVSPRTPTEEVVVGIWASVLRIEHVGIHDNFFDLGGHSLLAMQVMSRLRDAFQVEVPLRALFDAPTVAGLTLHLEAVRQAKPVVPAPPIVPRPRQDTAPVCVVQEQIWRFEQLLPGLPLFNIPYAMRLTGTLDVAALEQSYNEIIRRHEALRTTFVSVDGRPLQAIAPALHLSMQVVDLSSLPERRKRAEAQRLTRAAAQEPFDLVQGPLLRIQLLRLDAQEHILLTTIHHIISDGWSLSILTHELAVLYTAFSAGGPSPLLPLPIQYADFAHWQQQWRHGAARDTALAYWQEQLHDPLPVLELPTDRPRTAALSFDTARQFLRLPGELVQALTHLSRREGSTLFMTLLTAFKILLHSYTGQADLCVATLLTNRPRREIEGVLGLFINTVLLRTNLGGDPTLRQVLRQVRDTTLAAYVHQDLPFEDLVQTLERERALKRSSLCQVMFVLQHAAPPPRTLPGLTLRVLAADQSTTEPGVTATTFDCILMVRETPQGLTGACIYKTALFDAATIKRLLGDFQEVLERLVAQPEQPLSTIGSLGSK